MGGEHLQRYVMRLVIVSPRQFLVILNRPPKALECLACGTECIELVFGKPPIGGHFILIEIQLRPRLLWLG